MKSHESWHGFKIHWNTETVVARVSHAKWTCSRDEEAQQFLFLFLYTSLTIIWPTFCTNVGWLTTCRFIQSENTASHRKLYLRGAGTTHVQYEVYEVIQRYPKYDMSQLSPLCPIRYTFVTHLWNNERHWLPSPDHQLQVTPTAVRRRSPPEIPRNLWPPTLELATPWQSLLCQGMTD
jgi:hypothetical protein